MDTYASIYGKFWEIQIHSCRTQISGCLGLGMNGRTDDKGAQKTFLGGDDRCIYFLNCSDGFVGMHMYPKQ